MKRCAKRPGIRLLCAGLASMVTMAILVFDKPSIAAAVASPRIAACTMPR